LRGTEMFENDDYDDCDTQYNEDEYHEKMDVDHFLDRLERDSDLDDISDSYFDN
jgi:hypothetical protein